jgi:hypothetical protein
MDNIKIIRLQSGEDIIASFEQEQYSITVKDPMSIIFKRLPTGKAMMMMIPWIPMEIVSHNVASIDNENILTVFEPKDALVVYYNKSIEDLYNKAAEEYDEVEQSLLSDDDGDSDSDEYFEEVLENFNTNTKRTIH